MSKDKKKNPLNDEFARVYGISPGQQDNSTNKFHSAQYRHINDRIKYLEKQIQNIHQKLGGKEGHTLTHLSLENHGLKQECYRLNEAITGLHEELLKYKEAYRSAQHRIAQADIDNQFLIKEISKHEKGDVFREAGKQIKLLKDKLKEAEDKIARLQVHNDILRVEKRYPKGKQECHKISLKF